MGRLKCLAGAELRYVARLFVGEQPFLRAARRRDAEVGPGKAVENAPASGARDETELDQVGFDHFLDRVARLGEAGGEGFDPDRAALVQVGDHHEIAPVHRVEAELVDLHPGERAVGGGPVGVETLAAGLSEPRDTIEEVIEPYLIQLGLIARTARGRCLNGPGWTHLGLPQPKGQPGLFDGK